MAKSIIWPTICSVVIFLPIFFFHHSVEINGENDFGQFFDYSTLRKKFAATFSDSPAGPIYSIVVLLWAPAMMEGWKRRAYALSIRWGTAERKFFPQYRTKWLREYSRIYKVSSDSTDVNPYKADDLQTKFIDIEWENRYCSLGHRARLVVGFASLAFTILLVLAIDVAIILVRLSYTLQGEDNMVFAAAAVNGCTIQITSYVYTEVAKVLTEWENHRTFEESENAYINKTFVRSRAFLS